MYIDITNAEKHLLVDVLHDKYYETQKAMHMVDKASSAYLQHANKLNTVRTLHKKIKDLKED